MKKGYYIVCVGADGNTTSSGVRKKIDMQVNCFSKVFEIDLIEIKEVSVSFIGRFCRRLPFCSVNREYEKVYNSLEAADFMYIRRTSLDNAYINFLNKIRERYPKCKIVMEISTYPYNKEYCSLKYFPYLMKDWYYRKHYKKCVDRFVTYTQNMNEVFGVKTIETMNGIDVGSIVQIKKEDQEKKNQLDLIFVGHMQKSHGLERLIKGLRQYYQKEQDLKVFFHCVGDGNEFGKYQKLVKEYRLDEYVFFYGKRTGKELENIYNRSDVAVSALSIYKTGIALSSALKTREYLAKGIPMIAGGQTDVFQVHPCDYHLDFPNDNSVIDIEKIIEYYKILLKKYGDKNNLAKNICQYASKYIDNWVVLKPIIDYILED